MHPFTLANSSEEEHVIIGTHVREGSQFKAYLKSLTPGSILTMRGPMLDFVLEARPSRAVFLAQGIGITPFRSMLLDNYSRAMPTITHLVHVDSGDHVYRATTEPIAATAAYPTTRGGFTGETTAIVGSLGPGATYFLSGSRAFVRDTTEHLSGLGIDKAHIKLDTFLGY